MDDAVKIRILNEAAALFGSKGYRNVTLSELATRLGMSKKTLYQYFSGKEEIAEAVLDLTLQAIASGIAERMQQAGSGDPLQILQTTFEHIKNEIVKLHPLFLEDIQKYVPRLWTRLEMFRSRQLMFLEQLLKQAMQAGRIRQVDTSLVTAIMLECIQHIVKPDFAAKHEAPIMQVADTLFSLFLDGLRID
ncbi:TetR/AcrR family transcriptional regulator [Paenibacillus aestuarii]|uniref:TetR/AcrR family transcriptional regulator n=1 Tax=Paenibacillus aestuarii TaxID=516965 RepID=A0ABW0KFP7_9BACL|nr:TetR/AcrR family transcriptional regulator [Paenibacillus aestuarii]